MDSRIKQEQSSLFRRYFWQLIFLIPIAVALHYYQTFLLNRHFRYTAQTNLEIVDNIETPCKKLWYEIAYLRKELFTLKQKLEEVESWNTYFEQNLHSNLSMAFDKFYSDQIGMFDYASEYAGGSIISTPDTIPYPSKFVLRLFGTIDWGVDSEPRFLLQHASFPGKCYAFYGNKGRIRISLAHPVVITHVSLEHLRLENNLSNAPKDFQVLGIGEQGEENLGTFVYDLDDSIIQTFVVLAKNQTFRSVELRILDNYGNDEMTCVYRFRVHSVNLGLK